MASFPVKRAGSGGRRRRRPTHGTIGFGNMGCLGSNGMAGNSFSVDTAELQSVTSKLQGVQQDSFTQTTSPLAQTTFYNATASDVQQSALSGKTKQIAEMDGGSSSTSFGSTDYIDAIGVLNQAHCQLQNAIYGQFGTVNSSVESLHTRLAATQKAYSGTDTDLNGAITNVQRQASS